MNESKIVDHRGNPFSLASIQEMQTARLVSLHREFAGHPSRGLTPYKLAGIMLAAEQGDMMAQSDLYEDMEEKDGHIFAEMSKRRRAILGLDWDIVPPPNPSAKEQANAELVKDLITSLDIHDCMFDITDGIGKAFACIEMKWQVTEGHHVPSELEFRPQRWFTVNQDDRNELRLRDGSMHGEALQPFTWIRHEHRAKSGYLTRAALFRVLAWPYLFKAFSVRDLAEFLEIYGLPLRLGTYPSNAEEEEKEALFRAVMSIGHNAGGIVPQGTEIEFHNAATGDKVPFEAMIGWCERTQSKAILGGTLTSQTDSGSGAFALGNVHLEVMRDLTESDANQIARTLTRDLVYPLSVLNIPGLAGPQRAPRFQFDTQESEDLSLFSEALPKLVNVGQPIPANWVSEKLRIPTPKEGELVLTPAPGPGAPAPVSEIAAAVMVALNASAPRRDELEILVDDLAADWEPVMSPMMEPIFALADASTSFDEFQAGLDQVLKEMDSSALTELLAQGQFSAAVWGRLKSD